MSESPVDAPVLLRREGGIAVLTLNRPQRRNAMSRSMQAALYEQLYALSKEADCRAIVLEGAGGCFCAGGDFEDNEGKIRNSVEGRVRLMASARLIELLLTGPKPVIAAVEGHAYGAGLAIALACDYIVGAADAKFCAALSRLGLAGELGLTWTLPRRVGMGRTKQLLMLSKVVTGEAALAMNLVDECSASGGALDSALAMAAEFAQAPPLAVAYTKAALAQGHATPAAAMATEHDYQGALYTSRDHANAVIALFKKRQPEFKGE